MTEIEYVIANFAERFASFREKRIVLHGSRNYAEAIIENFADRFNFIGIMSLEPIDKDYFHGIKVVHEEELSVLDVDVVILTERVKYAVEAFRSIRRVCKKSEIAIYNMYGVDEFCIHHEAENAKTLSLPEAKKLCDSYDMVVFEVMDVVFYFSTGITGISLRAFFYDLITYLREQKKDIKFSLRKSFPADLQIESLKHFGLLLDEGNEIVYRKGEDLSFREIRENALKAKILYFGYGLANEFILPRCYGIDTCRFIEGDDSSRLIPINKDVKRERKTLSLSRKRIKEQIVKKKLISFDIFDTLLTRKTLYPRDVFQLVEKKAVLKGLDVQGFASARIRAEEDQPFCDFDKIYEWLQDFFNWTEDIKLKVRKIELDTELEVLVPRNEIAGLLRFALEAGKKVVLTSDMYFSAGILKKILDRHGISGYDNIFVSCDIRKSKNSGLYGELLRLCNSADEILHIGDNPVADGSNCEVLGIESILIPSALELARERGWEKSIRTAASLTERCLLGLIISKIFNDPFQSSVLLDYSEEVRVRRFGISVIAPVAVGYLTWLIQKLREDVCDGVLFLARDGWLLYNIYNYFCTRVQLPRPIYYYANRHTAFLCCADSKSEIDYIADLGQMNGIEAGETLKNIFHISRKEMLPQGKEEKYADYIARHIDLIRENESKIRTGYIQYSSDCGILEGGTYALVDFIAVGHIQNYLSRFLPYHLKGFYFWNYTFGAPLNSNAEYYLKNKNYYLLQTYIEKLETFFTSPEPSQKMMTEQGTPLFFKDYRNSQELKEIESVLKSAEEFAREYFDMFYCYLNEGISPSLIEKIYETENYPVVHYTIYDDWIRVARRKREEMEKRSDEKN